MNTKEPQACDVTENRFPTVFTFLRMAGVTINKKKPSVLTSGYNVLVTLHGYTLYPAFLMNSIVHIDDLKLCMKTFRAVVVASLILWLFLNLSWRLRDFEHLLRLTESFTWEDQPTRDPHTGHRTLAGWIPHLQKVVKYVTGFTMCFHVAQSGVKIFTLHEILYPAWYPFDTVNSPGYELVILMQIFGTLFYLGTLVGFISLYITLVMVACSQLEKLRTNLLNIKQELAPSGADSGSDGGEESVSRSEDGFCRMQRQLNECVRHHQAILQYMRALEDTLNFTLCGAFLIMLATLCFVSFSAVMAWGDATDSIHVFYLYVTMIGYLCVFCLLGTELTQQAESVRDAAWGCDWIGTPVPFQRCLAFIIATANKEFILTAGKFVPVSNSTMMNMVNQSISLFMFLLTMKDKSEESIIK